MSTSVRSNPHLAQCQTLTRCAKLLLRMGLMTDVAEAGLAAPCQVCRALCKVSLRHCSDP